MIWEFLILVYFLPLAFSAGEMNVKTIVSICLAQDFGLSTIYLISVPHAGPCQVDYFKRNAAKYHDTLLLLSALEKIIKKMEDNIILAPVCILGEWLLLKGLWFVRCYLMELLGIVTFILVKHRLDFRQVV